ncbi:MAG: HindVP family restriction endonuclease [Luteolibacter sp.]
MLNEENPKPTLYGISESNRDSTEFWGKNQFNSSFPAALACWMRDEKINPVYVHTSKGLVIAADNKITFDDVFNTKAPNASLRFDFESKFNTFQNYCHDSLEAIDLVISEKAEVCRALEVKLTVIPDHTTCERTEPEWGCELVVRPVSVIYAALTIYHSLRERKVDALALIEKTALDIGDWTNQSEILSNREQIIGTLEIFLDTFSDYQVPLVLQPVWKTVGKLPELSDQAFDIFVWSNMALCRLFLNQEKEKKSPKKVSRHLRASARLLRCLHDLFTAGKMRRSEIARMALGYQTDKEFAANGMCTNKYMRHARLETPKVHKSVLSEIILNGGEKELSPERRFDATIFFTATELFEKEDLPK